MSGLLSLCLAALLAAPPPPVQAQGPTAAQVAEAKGLYRAGSQAYAQGRYTTAIELFEQARDLVDRDALLFSLAQAYRLQYFVDGQRDRLERAVALYRAYLARVPEGGRRDHAVQHLSTLAPIQERLARADSGEAQRARIIVSSPQDDATARLGEADEAVPLPATFSVEPGPYTVQVQAPGYAAVTQTTQAVSGGVAALSVTLDPLPGQLTVAAPAGARVAVDGALVGRAPLPGPVPVQAGPHTVAVLASGRAPFVALTELSRGGQAAVDAELAVSGQRIAAWITLGAGAVLAVSATTTGLLALDRQDEVDALRDRYGRGGLTVAQVAAHNAALGERDDLVNATIGLGVGAGLGLAVGLGLYLFDDPAIPRPLVTPDGLGVSGRW